MDNVTKFKISGVLFILVALFTLLKPSQHTDRKLSDDFQNNSKIKLTGVDFNVCEKSKCYKISSQKSTMSPYNGYWMFFSPKLTVVDSETHNLIEQHPGIFAYYDSKGHRLVLEQDNNSKAIEYRILEGKRHQFN